MAAEAARVLDYTGSGYYGSAAPARAPYMEPLEKPMDIPVPQERTQIKEKAKEAAAQKALSVSPFAVFGAIFVGILMIFTVLAQISFSEIASETVRLNVQFSELTERERRLEIEFESAIDMKEIERYARDVLGMSRPDADQVAVIRSMPTDNAEIMDSGEGANTLSGFGAFISSLMEYFG